MHVGQNDGRAATSRRITALAARRPWRRAAELVRSIDIVRRRGLIDLRRPSGMLRSLRVARTAGPFAAMIVNHARDSPDLPAVIDERGALTFGELDQQANALARGLIRIGIRDGHTVGVLCRDHRGTVLTLIAAGRMGVRVVLLNTGFAGPQLADVVRRERVDAILLDGEFLGVAGALPLEMTRVVAWTDEHDAPQPGCPTVDELIVDNSAAPLPLPAKPGGMVLLTSGTTGTPRGTPRDRISPFQSAELLDRIPLTRSGAMVIAAPLFHGTGLPQFVLAIALGKAVVLRQRQFDPERTLADVAQHRADTLIVVPTMLQRIVDLGPGVLKKHDTSSLSIIACGGSALSPDLCRRTAEAFGDVLYNTYGSTETAIIAVATPSQLHSAPGTVGSPPVGCHVAIFDANHMPMTIPNVCGDIFVRTGLSSTGYTDGERKDTIGGLVSTGDTGHFDDNGLLFVDGRNDDMIVSGGENVFPIEVEHLLVARPDVQEAAVVGVTDPDFGQRLAAYVVAAPSAELDAELIRGHVRANLARFKVPRDVFFVTALPRNATGKIVRAQLVEPIAEEPECK